MACGLEGLFDLEIEFMRCVQMSIQSIISEYHLPRLFESGSGALWLTWAQSSKKFDKDIMDMIGISEDAGDLWEQYLETSTIQAFFSDKDWLTAWCNSEVDDAVQQIDDIMLRPHAWETAFRTDPVASESEIWPPKCAEDVWGVFVSIVQKSGGLPKDGMEVWLKKVGRPFLMDFGRRLSTTAETAEAFKDMLEPNRAHKALLLSR